MMPNTPALVREGATAIAADPDATLEDMGLVEEMMSALGTCVRVKVCLLQANKADQAQRERSREVERGRESSRERERVCVCVRVRVHG